MASAPPRLVSNQNYAYAPPYPLDSSDQYYASAPPPGAGPTIPQSGSMPQQQYIPYSQSLPQAAVPQNTYSSSYALPPQNAYSYPSDSAGPSNGASQYPYQPQPQRYQPVPSYTSSAPPQSIPRQHTPYYPPVPTQGASNSQPTRTDDRRLPQHASKADVLATVSIQDGDDPKSFAAAEALGCYTRMFPEAENDQGCRLFVYGPKCPTALLMTLFEHFDFPRYSLFPYGLFNDFAKTNKPDAGSCKCQRCTKGEACGHWALHCNLQFYLQQDILPSSNNQPKVKATSDVIIICPGDEYVAQLLLFCPAH